MPLRGGLVCCVVLLPCLTACGGTGAAGGVECAPFARAESGVQLFGDAGGWWEEARGRYARSNEPSPGAVLVFRRSGRLPAGHVSVVAEVDGPGEIRVDQANWVHGRVTRGETVVDVSPGGDWSVVRVWWAPAHALGVTTYPTYGFVGPAGAPVQPDMVASQDARGGQVMR